MSTTQKDYTIYGNHPREFIRDLFQSISGTSRNFRGEKDSYRITQSTEQSDDMMRSIVVDNFTIEMYSVGVGELDFVPFDVLVTRKSKTQQEEDGSLFIPTLITLQTPQGRKHKTGAVLFPCERLFVEEPFDAYMDEVKKWERTFNDFISHAHIVHYKNLAGI